MTSIVKHKTIEKSLGTDGSKPWFQSKNLKLKTAVKEIAFHQYWQFLLHAIEAPVFNPYVTVFFLTTHSHQSSLSFFDTFIISFMETMKVLNEEILPLQDFIKLFNIEITLAELKKLEGVFLRERSWNLTLPSSKWLRSFFTSSEGLFSGPVYLKIYKDGEDSDTEAQLFTPDRLKKLVTEILDSADNFSKYHYAGGVLPHLGI